MKALRYVRAVVVMMKPSQLLLLMITMYGAYFAAGGGFDPMILALLFITGVGSAGGVTALNMYIEHDIDSVMGRTSNRPIPRGEIPPFIALILITIIIATGIIAGSLINKWVMMSALAGLYFDIVAYTELFKRHTPWALLAGSVAGSMPALGGWAAGHGGISIGGILLAATVYVWQPLHVSFIHYAYSRDYEAAGIPTLHGTLGLKSYGIISLLSIIGLIVISWLYVIIAGYGYLTGIIVSILGVAALRSAVRFIRDPSPEGARRMIKLASPAIGLLFILLPVEHALLHILGV